MSIFESIDWFQVGQTAGVFLVGIGIGIVPKIVSWFKGEKKPKNKSTYKEIFDIKEIAEDDLKMQDLMTELRMFYDCDRVFIYLFHNGGSYLDGSPMKKTSMIYESVRRGISYEASNSRDLCVSTIPALTDIVSGQTPHFVVVEDMKDDFFKHLLENRNVEASAYCTLKKGLQIIGFVGLHYCRGSKYTKECAMDLDMMKQYTSCIEVCLMDRFKHVNTEIDKKDSQEKDK